jgi:hypothetical protein
MFFGAKRWKHFAAMALLGDGVMAVIHPRRDAADWVAGPAPWRALMRGLEGRPGLTRAIGAAQVAAVIWWTLTQEG